MEGTSVMTTAKDRRCGTAAMAAALMASLLSSCQPCAPIWGPGYPDTGTGTAACGECANGKKDEFTVKDLAGEIDHLEKHVEKYGSIVPQHASVWGQSRLMMYRHEFEREMYADLTTFHATLQASISTSDQAYLASALSLQAAVSGGKAVSPEPSTLVTSQDTVISRNSLLPKSLGFAVGNGALSLEPTTYEDQKKRFLDHLNELRRINEGDDNADAPGYGLNLVRLPVSVLPGCCTQTGYGAECTVTATPHLPPDLLPQTFRNLVINDLLDLLTIPLTQILGNFSEQELNDLYNHYLCLKETQSSKDGGPHLPVLMLPAEMVNSPLTRSSNSGGPPPLPSNFKKFGNYLSASGSLREGKERAMPPSQVLRACVPEYLLEIAIELKHQLQDRVTCANYPYHLDVQAALRAELAAAFDLLATQQYHGLWAIAGPDLVDAIRNRDVFAVANKAAQLRTQLNVLPRYKENEEPDCKNKIPPQAHTATLALAWAVVLDSSLLTERFLQDMRRTHDDKGCACAPNHWLPLYDPYPPPVVCQQFNEYVRCRWPLRVFALDPVTDDQNVADTYMMRRETQLALSLAFASGKISAGSFTRYVRRIEQDIQTIALNRTAVGFSHGDHTFGWRFYPRVQTPPVPGNLTVIARDLLIGSFGPSRTLRHERLEAGIRECVALVIMPSFIPGVDLEVVGNWFRLACPKCKALDLQDALRLSRTIRVIQDRSGQACDHDLYRAGDGELVMARLDQLSQRLPLQHQQVEVPLENTHGGFELLSSGVTDLAPELIGWYGAPGIDPCNNTSVFLVGDNFSVHQTRVIVGGQMLDPRCPAACTSNVCIPGAGSCVACASTGTSATQSQTPAPTVIVPVVPTPPSCPTPAVPSCPMPVGPELLPAPMPPPPEAKDNKASAESDGESPVMQAGLFNCKRVPNSPTSTSTNTINVSPTVTATPTASPTLSPTITASPTATASPTITAAVSGTNVAANVGGGGSSATASAGAPCVYQIELLSRQVMRVVIPKGVQSKNGMVDIHIATPYGVSPALSIPLVCEAPNCPPAQGAKAQNPVSISVNPVAVPQAAGATTPTSKPDPYSVTAGSGIAITYHLDAGNIPLLDKVVGEVGLTLGKDTTGKDTTPPAQMMLSAVFPLDGFKVKATSGTIVTPNPIVFKGAALDSFAHDLLKKLVPPVVQSGNIPTLLKSDSVQVIDPTGPTGKSAKVTGTIPVGLILCPTTARLTLEVAPPTPINAGGKAPFTLTIKREKCKTPVTVKFDVHGQPDLTISPTGGIFDSANYDIPAPFEVKAGEKVTPGNYPVTAEAQSGEAHATVTFKVVVVKPKGEVLPPPRMIK